MTRGLRNALVLTAALGASGCSEKDEPLPSAPEYHAVTSQTTTCDFIHINQLANSYFGPPRQQVVRDLVSAMDAAAPDFGEGARGYGFDIMAHMDTAVSNSTAGDPTVGSDLVNHLILCMYNRADPSQTASYPATFPEDFTVALNPSASAHGAFSVKPGFTGDAAAILSRPVSEPFSGVAPSSGTWADVLVTRSGHPDRVLFYGRPGSTSTTYDWKTVPHDATFDSIVVAVCIEGATLLLNEENVGLLPFVEGFLPATCSPTSTALADPGVPSMLVRGLARFAVSVFGPRALSAAVLSPGGLGGTTGAAKSDFGPWDIDHVTLEFQQQPTSTKVNTTITPAVTVKATAYPTGGGTPTTLPNVAVTLAAVNNNGTPANLVGVMPQITDGSGIASFSDLQLTKTGAYRLLASGVVGGRPAIPVSQATSLKFNIAPSK